MQVDPADLKKRTLKQVEGEQVFCASRGDRITNIFELANCIENLEDHHFEHHTASGESDFACWVHDVLENPLLAHDLSYPANLEDKEHCAKTIRDHVAWLETL